MSASPARSRAASAKQAETNGQRRPAQRSPPTASSAQSASRRLELQLGSVAGLGLVEPALHRLPGARVTPLGHQERLEALQLPAADVVLAPLEHRDGQLAAERAGGDRHVLVQELLLQRLRRRRDDDALTRLERRQEVREALPDARARLGDEVLTRREGVFDRARQRGLLRPRLVLGQGALERATGAEDLLHLQAQPTRPNGCSPSHDDNPPRYRSET